LEQFYRVFKMSDTAAGNGTGAGGGSGGRRPPTERRGGAGGGGGRGGRERGGRDRRNRGQREQRQDRDEAEQTRPVILAKPDRHRQQQQQDRDFPTLQMAMKQASQSSSTPDPERNTSSPGIRVAGAKQAQSADKEAHRKVVVAASENGKREGATAATTSKGATATLSSAGATPNQERCCRLIDDSHQVSDNLLSFLTDNTDFLVIGVMGPQSAGKSTVLNALIGDRETSPKSGKTAQQQQAVVFCRQCRYERKYCTRGGRGGGGGETRKSAAPSRGRQIESSGRQDSVSLTTQKVAAETKFAITQNTVHRRTKGIMCDAVA
jgi:hypothetical protein